MRLLASEKLEFCLGTLFGVVAEIQHFRRPKLSGSFRRDRILPTAPRHAHSLPVKAAHVWQMC